MRFPRWKFRPLVTGPARKASRSTSRSEIPSFQNFLRAHGKLDQSKQYDAIHDLIIRGGDPEQVWQLGCLLVDAYREGFRSTQIDAALAELIGSTTPIDKILSALAGHFDGNNYIRKYEDVGRATDRADIHYLLYGWKENRIPSIGFDPEIYTEVFPEIGLDHFILSHYNDFGQFSGRPANGISDELWFEPKAPDDEAWSSVDAARFDPAVEAVVVMPVYKGYDETLSAIFHCLKGRSRRPYSLLVVNDASPDEALCERLADLAAKELFDYHVNEANLGFVRTVNLSFENLTRQKDVVLLNADAFVFPGWFDRLVAHAERDATAATVTPLSNNATICSYPVVYGENSYALELSPRQLDRLASRVNAGLSAEAPTGVGFCMWIRRAALDDVGTFDAKSFRLGYGEENDFCLRALENGYRNLVATDVFAHHVGSVSFLGTKSENSQKGFAALRQRHPHYLRLLEIHTAADPVLRARRRLDAERLIEAFHRCVVICTHGGGGGVETYVKRLAKAYEDEGIDCLLLKVHDQKRVSLRVPIGRKPFVPNLMDLDLAVDWDFLAGLLSRMDIARYHVNSLSDLAWDHHEKLLDLIETSGVPATFVGHDYGPISEFYTLLRPDNVYLGTPDIETLRSWQTMGARHSWDTCDPAHRIERYARFLKHAETVEIPSRAAAHHYATVFPDLALSIVPHAEPVLDAPQARRRPRDTLSIVVVGAIGPHKGFDVLSGLAAYVKSNAAPIELHLVGYSSNDAELLEHSVDVTGRYRNDREALARIETLQPDLFFVPSICPETYCFTLSMALNCKIPPVVFDLGAQAERVAPLAWGVVLPLALSRSPKKLCERLCSLPVDRLWIARS